MVDVSFLTSIFLFGIMIIFVYNEDVINMKKIGLIFCILLLCGCSKKEMFSHTFFSMDTVIQIKLYNVTDKESQTVFREIEELYQKYDTFINDYNENSEISHIHNNVTEIETLSLSPEVYHLLELGDMWHQKSGGLLNIQIGELTHLWHDFRESGIFPSTEQLQSISTDYTLKLLGNNKIQNNHPYLDLGAITKGYITELAGNLLEEKGIETYLINAGGNVKVGKSNKGYYNIGIASPIEENNNIMILKAENVSVVTSGGYERFINYEGKTYHHIIDPNTKYPAEYVKSVTVIGKDSGQCDALSTILFLMSVEDGQEFIKDYNVDVVWVTLNNKIIKSEGFHYESK